MAAFNIGRHAAAVGMTDFTSAATCSVMCSHGDAEEAVPGALRLIRSMESDEMDTTWRRARRDCFPPRSPSITSSSLSRVGTGEDDKATRHIRQQQQKEHSHHGGRFPPRDSSEKESNDCGWPLAQRSNGKHGSSRQRGTYLSTPLRWQFLVAEMVLLAAALFVVVVLQRGMPGSDNSAVVDGQHVAKRSHHVESTLPPGVYLGTARGDGRVSIDGGKGSKMLRSLVSVTTAAQATAPAAAAPSMSPLLSAASGASSRRARIRLREDGAELGAEIGASTNLSSPVDPAEPVNTAATAAHDDSRPSTPDDAVTAGTATLDSIWGGGQPSNVGVAFPRPRKSKTASAPSSSQGAIPTGSGGVGGSRTTDFVVHTTHIALDSPQTIKESALASAEAVPTPQLAPLPSMPSSRTVDVVVGATTTTFLATGAAQRPQTVEAIFGGQTTRSVVVDDGLVAETSTLVTAVGGTLVTLLAITTPGRAVTETSVSTKGGTTLTVTPPPTTITTDLGGGQIVTTTSTPPPYVTTTGGSTTTLVWTTTPGRLLTTAVATTIDGTPTSLLTVLTVTPTPSTRWTTPSATPSSAGPASGDGYGSSNGTAERVLPALDAVKYFAGNFLPTLIAVALAVPVGIIDLNAKLLQPFRTLAMDGGSATTVAAAVGGSVGDGAAGSDTLTVRFGGGFLGIPAVPTPISQAFRGGQPVPQVTSMLMWLSWMLAPLAAEAISFKLHGTCSRTDPAGCGIELGVSPGPTFALVVVLALMLALLIALTLLLRGWDTGLYAHPWSPAGGAARARGRGRGDQLRRTGDEPTEKDLVDLFAHGRFRLETSVADDVSDDHREKCYDYHARHEYGIVPVSSGSGSDFYNHNDINITGQARAVEGDGQSAKKTHMPFPALTYTWQGVFTAALLGLMALLIYYDRLHEYNSFEQFMDSETFGVKFLFAALGTAISTFWTSFFQSVATITPFRRMAQHPRRALQSVLIAPPTITYSGITTAKHQRDAQQQAAAKKTSKAELFLPVLLANIPYALTQTLESYTACASTTLALLASMVAVLAASMIWVRWPHMPVDPRTLAGAIYYVADSPQLLRDMRGRSLATKDCRSRDAEIEAFGRQYFYGRVRDSDGRPRMVVDAE